MNVLVSLKNVSLNYHSVSKETPAVNNLSFEVKEGEFVAIVGPSGCGKTTVLQLVMGLLEPESGTLDCAPQLRMGYMLQQDNLLEWRSVRRNAELGLELKKKLTPESRKHVLTLLGRYGLGDFLDSKPSQLSGGMRQKAALIRTLAMDPALLLLDEPFSALDYQTRISIADEVYGIIKNEGKTAILVTHDISEAVAMADRILVFSGRPASLSREVVIELDRSLSPLQRRSEPGFAAYFSTIWKELQDESAVK